MNNSFKSLFSRSRHYLHSSETGYNFLLYHYMCIKVHHTLKVVDIRKSKTRVQYVVRDTTVELPTVTERFGEICGERSLRALGVECARGEDTRRRPCLREAPMAVSSFRHYFPSHGGSRGTPLIGTFPPIRPNDRSGDGTPDVTREPQGDWECGMRRKREAAGRLGMWHEEEERG